MLISDVEYAKKIEASIPNIIDPQEVIALRSALIHYYSKNKYTEDLIRLIAEPDLLSADDSQHILGALIDSKKIEESESFVANMGDDIKDRWGVRVQLARLELETGRFDSSLEISKSLLQEKKENATASGLFMLSLTRLDRYLDLFEYIESASEQALSPDWAALAFAHSYNLSNNLNTPRMLCAIEKISRSRALDYRLWSVRLKRMAGFVNEALQELREYGPTELCKVDYENELNLISLNLWKNPIRNKIQLLSNALPLNKMILQVKKIEKPPEPMTEGQIKEIILNCNLEPKGCIVISVTHDNYKNNSGGIQLCVQLEEKLAIQQGWYYLNVHPWQPLPLLVSDNDCPDPLVSLMLNGQFLGTCYSSVLTLSIKEVTKKIGISIYPVIHSLMGHSINHVKEWVSLNKNNRCWIWLHDFFTLCPSLMLQRNNISFCNAPSISSNSCSICNYFDERPSHLKRISDLFSNVSATIISPSEGTKKLWLSKVDCQSHTVKVLPHMKLEWLNREKIHHLSSEKPISVAFLGGKVDHKGWCTFEKLVDQFSNSSEFKFYYFGNHQSIKKGVHNIKINVSAEDPFSMINAISEMEIDFVLHWAMWPETFSFTTHEAIAGGAHILTNPDSGNIAAVVSETGRGTILSDENALLSFFSQGKAAQTAKNIRFINSTHRYKVSFSKMTIPMLMNEHLIQ